MPRKRMIAPEFFSSRTMNDLAIHTMVTFEGCWCFADDAGRFDDDEVMVKAAVWPRRKQMTETKVRADLNALAAAGVLCQYVVNGFPLMHVTAWNEHQKINHPTPSKLPPCPEHEPEAWAVFESALDPALDKFRDVSRAAHVGLQEDSGKTPSQCSLSESKLTKSKGPGSRRTGTAQPDGALGLVSNG